MNISHCSCPGFRLNWPAVWVMVDLSWRYGKTSRNKILWCIPRTICRHQSTQPVGRIAWLFEGRYAFCNQFTWLLRVFGRFVCGMVFRQRKLFEAPLGRTPRERGPELTPGTDDALKPEAASQKSVVCYRGHVSILSRDPNLSTPSEPQKKQIRWLKGTMVEKNGESTPRTIAIVGKVSSLACLVGLVNLQLGFFPSTHGTYCLPSCLFGCFVVGRIANKQGLVI